MNRSQLIEAVAARAAGDPATARRYVDAVFETVIENVAAGDRVVVTGFGTFDRLARPARTARNPRTGLPVQVAAAEVPRFRVGQTFRDRVAAGPTVPEAAEPEAVEPAAAVKLKGTKPAKPVKSKAVKSKDSKPAKAVKSKAVKSKAVKPARTAKAEGGEPATTARTAAPKAGKTGGEKAAGKKTAGKKATGKKVAGKKAGKK